MKKFKQSAEQVKAQQAFLSIMNVPTTFEGLLLYERNTAVDTVEMQINIDQNSANGSNPEGFHAWIGDAKGKKQLLRGSFYDEIASGDWNTGGVVVGTIEYRQPVVVSDEQLEAQYGESSGNRNGAKIIANYKLNMEKDAQLPFLINIREAAESELEDVPAAELEKVK